MGNGERGKGMLRLKDYNDRPKCCKCQEPIYQEEAICHMGNWYCEDCEEYFFDIIKKKIWKEYAFERGKGNGSNKKCSN